MVIDDIEVTNVTCQSDMSVSDKNYGIRMMKAYVVSFVNADPSLKENALFWLVENFIFRSVKAREGWKRDHINRSYHSEFNTQQQLSPKPPSPRNEERTKEGKRVP
jgi:hypothetical protein